MTGARSSRPGATAAAVIAVAAAMLAAAGCTGTGTDIGDAPPSLPPAAAATIGSPGAGAGAETDVPARPAASTEQSDDDGNVALAPYPEAETVRAALADDRLTREEYENSFPEFQACMARYGASLDAVSTSGKYITYGSPGGDVDAYCYETFYGPVDAFWQTIENPRDDISADDVSLAIECLEAADVEPVVTVVPGGRRERSVAHRDLYEQIAQLALDGLLTVDQYKACHP